MRFVKKNNLTFVSFGGDTAWRLISQFIHFISSARATNLLATVLVVFMVSAVLWRSHGASNVQDVKLDCTPESFTSGDTLSIGNGTEDAGPSVDKGVNYTSNAAICQLAVGISGVDPDTSNVQLAGNPDFDFDTLPAIQRYGLLGVTEQQVYYALYNQPTTDVVYAMQQQWIPGTDSTNSPSVYAATDGYSYLTEVNGLSTVWQFTSGLSYFMFVLILITSGFMIMFRHKIGGQMAVTVFNMLPNVVISLILVVFSFAIAGLILNIGVLATHLADGALQRLANSLGLTNWQSGYADGPFSISALLLHGGGAGNPLRTFAQQSGLQAAISKMLGSIGGQGGGIKGMMVDALSGVIAGLAGGLMMIAMLILSLWLSLKVFITILKAYLGILLDVILAPLYIATSALPGQSHVKINVFRRILKNSLVFTMVFILINLGAMLLFSSASQVKLIMPGGLLNGSWNTSGSDLMQPLIKGIGALYLWSLASGTPKMLDDILPSATGRGMAEAGGIASKAMGSIPVIGGLFSG